MSTVALEGVSVNLGGVPVLHDLDLDAEAGEWLALIGPNGAGKTTALRTMAGLHRFRGTVLVDGQGRSTGCPGVRSRAPSRSCPRSRCSRRP